jgi:hypothetical protein
VAGLAVASIAYASIPDGNGVIHGCYSASGAGAKNGTPMNIIDSAKASCGKGQQAITWSQAGPPGPKGDTGSTGTDGVSVTSTSEPDGANCAYGGVKFTSASGVSYACNGAPGAPGAGISSLDDLSCTAPGQYGGPWGQLAGTVAAPTQGQVVVDVTIACVAKEHDSGIPGDSYRDFHVPGTPGDESTYTVQMLGGAELSVGGLSSGTLGDCSAPGGAFVPGISLNPAAIELTTAAGTAIVWSRAGSTAGYVHSDAGGQAICPRTSDPTWN